MSFNPHSLHFTCSCDRMKSSHNHRSLFNTSLFFLALFSAVFQLFCFHSLIHLIIIPSLTYLLSVALFAPILSPVWLPEITLLLPMLFLTDYLSVFLLVISQTSSCSGKVPSKPHSLLEGCYAHCYDRLHQHKFLLYPYFNNSDQCQ